MIDIVPISTVSRFRKLKDFMWIRESVEDVTAAEFACRIESDGDNNKEGGGRKKKRAVDYEKLLVNLDRRIGDMTCEPFEEIEMNDSSSSIPKIEPDRGMGRFAYALEQRVAWLE
jgi:hypothetical protein